MKTNKSLSFFHCLFNTVHFTKRTSFLRWCIQICHPQSSILFDDLWWILMNCEQDTPALCLASWSPFKDIKSVFPLHKVSVVILVIMPVATRRGFRVVEVLLVLVNHSSPNSVRHPTNTSHFFKAKEEQSRKCRNGTYYSYGCGLKQHQYKIIFKLEK